ncbi:hypothetical protein GQ43DRAFT_474703 [Delitschia confertaspora ATCC 74209]|uniref:Stress-associated endoplasmic reticulum protein n=1 Tax=Delitschia confertaspora ATCC 74209 TaxID=1513339 RepID=A0A9P4JHT1_9PLEO|nr:hypothetical protein GQ43DRAFT_474703 [Delitschia confertaspora ATCC 74209]
MGEGTSIGLAQIFIRTPMAQTPQQRAANARFEETQKKKMGKPVTAVKRKEEFRSPISKGWIIILGFVVCGGLIVELLRLLFG